MRCARDFAANDLGLQDTHEVIMVLLTTVLFLFSQAQSAKANKELHIYIMISQKLFVLNSSGEIQRKVMHQRKTSILYEQYHCK